jgi:hypothetical protein
VKDKEHIHGFSTPKGYFENFDEQLFLKIKEGPLPKETGFSLPEGYMDSFDERLFDRLYGSSEAPIKVKPLYRTKRFLYMVSVAASIALMFSVINFDTDLPKAFDELSVSTIERYIDEGKLELDSYDIGALLSDEEMSNLNLEDELYLEETLQEYLLENLDDTNLLIE